MNILLLTHIYPPAIDGGSQAIFHLGQQFLQNGNQIKILSTDCNSSDDFINPNYNPIKYSPDPNIYRLPIYHSLRRSLKALSLFLPLNSFLRHFLEIFQKGPIFKIYPFLKFIVFSFRYHPDLIIAGPFPTTISLYAVLLKLITGSKLLIMPAFHPTDSDFTKKPLLTSLKASNFIWSLTQFETTHYTQYFGLSATKIITAGVGIDPKLIINSKTKNHPDTQNILYIGSFSAHKGLGTLVKAFNHISADYPHLKLTLAGQATLFFPSLKSQIKQLPLSIQNRIKIIRNFPSSKLSDLIDNATILILPSLHESFGIVLLEAWVRQKPVITSDIKSLQEIVKKTHGGLIFKTNSYLDLSSKISELLNSPIKQKLFGLNGYLYVKNNYTWPLIYQKIRSILS